ncbi:flippase [Clostridium transplantifaecale]|uniref:flippase n=1 Tax=Clostridium transplantifaecale TaxID=2479838 RepID=UPI000F6374FF|nr:flippase [Clostridium transplantifaecale]
MQEKQKSLKLNFIMNAILTMSQFIFPLITFPYVSRILLPEGTGKVSFATSVISYFSMFAQLGIPTYGVRACAKVRDNRSELTKTTQEIFIINMVMTAMSYAVFVICLFTVPRIQQDKTLFIIISTTLIFNAIGVEWLYKGLEQYTYITVRSIIFKFVALVAMFLLIHEKNDLVIYGGISILAASASNVFNFFHAHRYVGFKPVRNYNFKKHLKAITIFFAMTCAVTVYTHLDTVMLGFMKTDADVGYYNAAVKIKSILVSVVTSLGTVLLPRASYYLEHNMKEEFERITRKAFNFVLLIATPLMVYFMVFAKEGIFFLSGDAYAGSILPMQVIMPTLLFVGLSNITGIQMLVPLGREKVVLYSEIAGAIVDLIINLLLIPSFGAVGAALGTTVAECVVMIWQYIVLRDKANKAYREVHFIPIIIGIVFGSVASVWVKTLGLSNFFTLVISAIIFFAIYALVLTIAREPMTLEIEKQTLKKVKGFKK